MIDEKIVNQNIDEINEIINEFTYDLNHNALTNYEHFHELIMKSEKLLTKKIFVKSENRKSLDEIILAREKNPHKCYQKEHN